MRVSLCVYISESLLSNVVILSTYGRYLSVLRFVTKRISVDLSFSGRLVCPHEATRVLIEFMFSFGTFQLDLEKYVPAHHPSPANSTKCTKSTTARLDNENHIGRIGRSKSIFELFCIVSFEEISKLLMFIP